MSGARKSFSEPTPDQLLEATAMRAQGKSWSAIGRAFGLHKRTIRMRLDLDFAEQFVTKQRSYDTGRIAHRRVKYGATRPYGRRTGPRPPIPEKVAEPRPRSALECDIAFRELMHAAIEAGSERAYVGIVTTPCTDDPRLRIALPYIPQRGSPAQACVDFA